MLKNKESVKELMAIMKRFDAGIASDQATQTAVKDLLAMNGQTFYDSLMLFRIYREYFNNPAIHAQAILKRLKISQTQLVETQCAIRNSQLLTNTWQSLLYPRMLLVNYGAQLTHYLEQHPNFVSSTTKGQPRMYMLEIHPTKGSCIYTCRMCLWSGGGKLTARQMKTDAGRSLMSKERWIDLLAEARNLGVRRVIISGGGEPLLDEEKFSEVTEAAIRLGIETIIYTNGRMLSKLSEKTMETIIRADWLRVSLHAATPDVYAQLVNRSPKCNDFEIVLKGIQRIIALKEKVGSSLQIGIGSVIQKTNFSHVPLLKKLGEHLGINFLDIRGDCIGISETLQPSQRESMFNDLRLIRDQSVGGVLPFNLTIADDLVMQMDQWRNMSLTPPQRCWIPVLRPAIDPYGTVCACDSIGEPFTRLASPDAYVFGSCSNAPLRPLFESALRKPLGVWCKHCMPGQISLNALFEKIVADYQLGILPKDQPYFIFKNEESH